MPTSEKEVAAIPYLEKCGAAKMRFRGARGNRTAARKVEWETCRKSRSRKLDFRKSTHTHTHLPSLPAFFSSCLFRSTRLVCNSPGKRRAIFRMSASSRTFLDYKRDFALYRACVDYFYITHVCACVRIRVCALSAA